MRALARLGIHTVSDLLTYYPRAYEDRRHPIPLDALVPDQEGVYVGQVLTTEQEQKRRGVKILRVHLRDGRGGVSALWFNQAYLAKLFRPGVWLLVAGKVAYSHFTHAYELQVRDFSVLRPGTPHAMKREQGIVPKYDLTEGISQRVMRRIVWDALVAYQSHVVDPLPEDVRDAQGFLSRYQALGMIHFPKDETWLDRAKARLVFEELFLFSLGMLLKRQEYVEQGEGIPFAAPPEWIDEMEDLLPFSWTGAQRRVLTEILADMRGARPMRRLLQGDVGSGKTLVAFAALAQAVKHGTQAALMAPTEILAEQHYRKLGSLCEMLGIRAALLTSRLPAAEKRAVVQGAADHQLDLLFGTHALIQEQVAFARLGFCVVDEQHRFGVMQRTALVEKGGGIVTIGEGRSRAKGPQDVTLSGSPACLPDLLVMSATPIPRSLSLTLYGDLDVSILDELPPGRKPIQTLAKRHDEREQVYQFVRRAVAAGQQAYIVYPLVEAAEKTEVSTQLETLTQSESAPLFGLSDRGTSGAAGLRAATEMAAYLQKHFFQGFRVALLHGRMHPTEKAHVMNDFAKGEIHVLVATTVVEVGVDVPNASVMVIEHAERFGLAQLHQLRGRVGRGAAMSTCFLVGNPKGTSAQERFTAMLTTQDGFQIAEADLKIRGPGDVLGLRQSGYPTFRIASIVEDLVVLQRARHAAQRLLARDPQVVHPAHQVLRTYLIDTYGSLFGFQLMH